MPENTIDVVFGRGSEHPVMYVLEVVKAHEDLHDQNLILTISNRTPRRLGGDRWQDDHLVGEVNRGWLYHGVLNTYPRILGTGCAIPSDTQVAAKWVRGTQAIESLRQEATMYDSDLRPLQGSSVPTFFGMFIGVHDGVDVGCLVLEWCPGNDPVADGKPTEDVLHMRAQAVRSLHYAGVHHGQLYERPDALCVSDGRHFLRAKDGTIRIVDFQRATRHNCVYRSDEVEGYGSFDSSECQELAFAAEYSHRAYMEGQLQCIPWNAF